jgi:hypothetical protein
MKHTRHITIASIIALLILVAWPMTAQAKAEQIVRVVAPTTALENPGWGKVVKRLGTTTPYGHEQLQLRVFRTVAGEPAVDGTKRWYYLVHLPYRRTALDTSNGHVGWVSSDRVQLVTTPWKVVINRSNRELTIKRYGKPWRKWKVVIGGASTPTGAGKFAIYGKTTRWHHFSGIASLPFSYSSAHAQFAGMPGMVALHGRSGAALGPGQPQPGQAGSNGCVRMDNRNMQLLADRLPIGTPIDVI